MFICMYVCIEESVTLTDSCELQCRYWELNPGTQEKEPVLLTAGPCLQPLDCVLSY